MSMKKAKPPKSPSAQASEARGVMTREQIMTQCAARPSAEVDVKGWPGKVRMRNVTFSGLIEMRASCPDEESYRAGLVALACADLTLNDAIALQEGDGMQFSLLFGAVNSFLNLDKLQDESLKN